MQQSTRARLADFLLDRIPISTWSDYWNSAGLTDEQVRHNYPEINLGRRTRLCQIMTRRGSDKGTGNHNYTRVYQSVLGGRSVSDLFELGVGTTNTTIRHNMGVKGTPGASLRGWRTFFPEAQIWSADIDRDALIQEERICCFEVDQTDATSIGQLWAKPELPASFDVMIDDGLHEFDANCTFLENSLHRLTPGGVYVVEDIDTLCLGDWAKVISAKYVQQFPGHVFRLCRLPKLTNVRDNNLLFIYRLT